MASTELRLAAKQALEALEKHQEALMVWPEHTLAPHECVAMDASEKAITALRAALAEDALQKFTDVSQEIEAALAEPVQEPVWVCPDSAEHRYQKPGHCEDCGKTLVQVADPVQEECDHCNQPLYAAIKCRVCGRVTPAEPVQEPVAWMVYTLDGKSVCVTDNPADFIEWRSLPLYTAPPQRKPLTEEEIQAAWDSVDMRHPRGNETRIAFTRAVERAHGIGGQP